MPEATVIVRVDSDLKTAFTGAANAADRTVSQLLRDFMRDYVRTQAEQVDYDAWFRRKIQIAQEAVARGEVVDGDIVEREFAAKRASTREDDGPSR